MVPETSVWSEALVNRNPYPEKQGSSPDSNDEAGVNYLRRLKGTGTESPSRNPSGQGASRPGLAGVGIKERRQTPRMRCSGSVEFQTAGNGARMWGTLTDISLHGCYVEISNTFPVDTKVNLVLKSCGLRIQVAGTVRASYPGLGMGICFAEVARDEQKSLEQLLGLLAGHISVSNLMPAPKTPTREEHLPKNAVESLDKRAFLDQIKEFFQTNQSLSREEFHAIAKRVRRP